MEIKDLVPRRTEDAAWVSLDESLILHLRTGRVTRLDAFSEQVWASIDGRAALGDIIEKFKSTGAGRRVVLRAIGRFHQGDLLELEAPPVKA